MVIGQKLMQAASDIFLAGLQDPLTRIQYYWWQFKDMKGFFDLDSLDKAGLRKYLEVCSLCLARVHARIGGCSLYLMIY
jgi:hypothetical protein